MGTLPVRPSRAEPINQRRGLQMEAADKGPQARCLLDCGPPSGCQRRPLLTAPRGTCSRNLSYSPLTHTLPLRLRTFAEGHRRAPPSPGRAQTGAGGRGAERSRSVGVRGPLPTSSGRRAAPPEEGHKQRWQQSLAWGGAGSPEGL